MIFFFIFGVAADVNPEKFKPKLLHSRYVTIIFPFTFTDIIVTNMQGPNLRMKFQVIVHFLRNKTSSLREHLRTHEP